MTAAIPTGRRIQPSFPTEKNYLLGSLKRSVVARKPRTDGSFLPLFLLLELFEISIVAGRAVVVLGGLLTMKPPVIPSPAFAILPVLVAVDVSESPAVLLLIPASPTALIPVVVSIGSVVPSPAIAVLPVLVAIAVAELPCVVLLNPLALASLIPVVLIGSEQAGRQDKRTDQDHNSC